ncbi:Cytochrome c oxidase Cu(A) center assembly protein [Bacillus cereus Rock3-42]|nr:Cytochrome c oxidase Cu(A) center assembly protein [Bacillus cereus Rock3-42]
MKRYQKVIGLMVVFCLFVLAGCSGSGSKLRKPLNWDLETFQFTNQDGKPFGTKDLKGKFGLQILCSQTAKQFVRQ